MKSIYILNDKSQELWFSSFHRPHHPSTLHDTQKIRKIYEEYSAGSPRWVEANVLDCNIWHVAINIILPIN